MANIYRDGYKIFPFLQPLQRIGSVAQSSMRLSAVDGAAFIDFGQPRVLTHYSGYFNKIIVIDSAGKKLTGYIKDAGTGETYGTNVLASLDFTSGWYHHLTTAVDANTFATTSVGNYTSHNAHLSLLGLYRFSMDSTQTGGTTFMWDNAAKIYALDGTVNQYKTVWAGGHILFANSLGGQTIDIVSATAEQVLTPSATGVTITSTSNGSTYNWTSQEAGFNYNDAKGYSFEIESIMKPAYLIGYRQESVQCYHDAMDMKVSFGEQRERKKISARGMHRGF